LRLEESVTNKKKKKRARALKQKTGMPYQAAMNVLNAGRSDGGAGGEPPGREEWRENRRAFRAQSLRGWAGVVSDVLSAETRRVWTQPIDIATVLQRVARRAPLNHCFMPRGGGLDLKGAAMSDSEPGCIVLDLDDSAMLLKPDVLELVHPGDDPLLEWTYFRLDLASLPASGVYDGLAQEEVGKHVRGTRSPTLLASAPFTPAHLLAAVASALPEPDSRA
jgi:hypothetical protein